MVASDLPIGDRVRHFRGNRQQDVVAGLVGISPDYLSQIERGLKVPSLHILHRLAQELGVPTAALLAEGPRQTPTVTDTTGAGIVDALMGYGPSRSVPAADPAVLRERVEAAWRTWQSSKTRFTDLATVLPELIADTEHAARSHRADGESSDRRETMRAAADLYFLLRSYLRRTGRTDLAMMAADRGVRAAEDADDPMRMAAAQWNLGHILLATDEPEGAEEVASRAAEHILATPAPEPERLALSGALGLVGVVAQARRRDWWSAREGVREHARVAQLVGEGNVAWTVFGPTNVSLHAVSIEMEAGEAGEALRMADRIDTSALPSREREFTFTLEVAQAYDLRREDAAVMLHLLDLEQVAPEDLARNPVARELVRRVMRRARAMHARQAEQLAERLGVL